MMVLTPYYQLLKRKSRGRRENIKWEIGSKKVREKYQGWRESR